VVAKWGRIGIEKSDTASRPRGGRGGGL